VTSVGQSCFSGNKIEILDLKNVVKLGDYAFCLNKLKEVNLRQLITLERNVFSSNNLKNIDLKNVTRIFSRAFYNNNLSKIDLKNVISLGGSPFEKNNITELDLKNVSFLDNRAFDNNIKAYKNGVEVRIIDRIPTIIDRVKQSNGIELIEGRIFGSNDKCFIVSKNGYRAHGRTLFKAKRDLFEKLKTNKNIIDLVKKIKHDQIITVLQYRKLTGACEFGCQNFLKINNLTQNEFQLPEALELLKGQYGYEKLVKFFGNE